MLSFTKTIATFPVRTHHHRRSIPPSSSLAATIRCDIIKNGNNVTSSSKETDSSSPSPTTPPADDNTVEIRFRRGSRRRRRREEQLEKDGFSTKDQKNNAPKDWSSMSLAERAVELYMGEKGLLFWLNKFAYASIFVVIGGWIVFRFVGPALNLYQLDTPPLAPASMFKGS